MATGIETAQAVVEQSGQAAPEVETLQQGVDDIMATVLKSIGEDGEPVAKGEPAPTGEVAKEEPKAEQPKVEEKKEEPQGSVASLMARAVKRDREAGEKLRNAEKLHNEAKGTLDRFSKINDALKGKDYLAAIRMLAPDVDPSAFLVEAFEAFGKNEAPLTQEQLRAQIRAEMEADHRARQEAEEAEKKRAIDEANAKVEQTFGAYLGDCEQALGSARDEYPILSSRGMFGRCKADMRAFAEETFNRTGMVPTPAALLEQVEKELAASGLVEAVKTGKKYGQPAQTQPVRTVPPASPTLTPRMTSAEQGMRVTGPARELSLAEEMAEISKMIEQRFPS